MIKQKEILFFLNTNKKLKPIVRRPQSVVDRDPNRCFLPSFSEERRLKKIILRAKNLKNYEKMMYHLPAFFLAVT